jgi:hypothetical protein
MAPIHGNIDDRLARAVAVKPDAFGVPPKGGVGALTAQHGQAPGAAHAMNANIWAPLARPTST